MLKNDSIRQTVKNRIASNLVVILIFLYWFFYSTFNYVFNFFLFCFSILFIVCILLIKHKKGLISKTISLYGLLMLVLLFFLLDIVFYSISNVSPFLFSFYNLIGLTHTFAIIIFSILLSLILIKLLGVYVYFMKNPRIIESEKGDKIFQFFTTDLSNDKLILLLLLFPLSSFVEELIYRSLILSFLIYYFNFELIVGVFFASVIFGFVHLSKYRGQVFSAFISSIIYFIALIQLGFLYSWIFHLLNNLFVLFFYYQASGKMIVDETY